jgi:pimeloyl-ACP methyl ester carboxylesterase
MAYAHQGPEDGVPLVLLHGVTDSWRSFEPLLRQLPPSRRVLALSQRGHGDTSRPASGYRYEDFAEDLAAFLDALGLPRAVIAGHSMGSVVAQRFALDHPERVAALVLMGAFSSLHRDPLVAEFVATQIAPLRDPIDPGFARSWQESTLARAIEPAFLETVVRETLAVPARVWREVFAGFLETPDFSAGLSAFSAPVLIAWGDRDAYAGRAHQDALLAQLPHARRAFYEGAGHAFHWEDPAQFARDLVAFLEVAGV